MGKRSFNSWGRNCGGDSCGEFGIRIDFVLAVAGGYIATQLAGSIYDRFH